MDLSLATLVQPFQFAFMQNAAIITVLVAVPTALLSCFLVLKGWALMGDAVSHAVLPGVVLAYILGIPLIVGAFAAGMFCAVATGYLSMNSRVKQDTIMGVVFSGMFAAGIVLYVAIDTNVHLDHILFGNMLGVQAHEIRTSAIVCLLLVVFIAVTWRDLLLQAFDEAQARASGLRVGLLHYALLAALSLTIVSTLTAAGLILAVGLLITPGAIAFLLVRRFSTMLLVAVLVNVVCMLAGVYASFWLDSAPAPTIILLLSAVFLLAFAYRLRRNRQHSRQRLASADVPSGGG